MGGSRGWRWGVAGRENKASRVLSTFCLGLPGNSEGLWMLTLFICVATPCTEGESTLEPCWGPFSPQLKMLSRVSRGTVTPWD